MPPPAQLVVGAGGVGSGALLSALAQWALGRQAIPVPVPAQCTCEGCDSCCPPISWGAVAGFLAAEVEGAGLGFWLFAAVALLLLSFKLRGGLQLQVVITPDGDLRLHGRDRVRDVARALRT